MKKSFSPFILFLFCSCSAHSQMPMKIDSINGVLFKNNFIKTQKKYFNIKYFESHKTQDANTSNYILKFNDESGRSFLQYNDSENYVEEIKETGNPIISYTLYSKANGKIKSSFTRLKGVQIGIVKEYDEDGNVLAQKNMEEDFIFSLSEFILRMEQLGVKILDDNFLAGWSRSRKPATYHISITNWRLNQEQNTSRVIDISGIDGHIINDQIFGAYGEKLNVSKGE